MIKSGQNVKILFPSSSGGHLAEIAQLKRLFENYEYLIVTEDIPLNRIILKERNYKLVRPNGQNRDLVFWRNFLINWFLSLKILLQFKPDIIITTGSHTAVPFCYLGKILGCKVIYILSFSRIDSRAKAADLVYPIADLFFVQWERMKAIYKKGIYAGPIF